LEKGYNAEVQALKEEFDGKDVMNQRKIKLLEAKLTQT